MPISKTFIAVAVSIPFAVHSARFASAGLISTISYHQQVIAGSSPLGSDNNYLNGSSLPVLTTVTSNVGNTTMSATYTFVDDGIEATLRVDTQTSLTEPGGMLGFPEGRSAQETTSGAAPINGFPPDFILLTFSQPVNYVFSMSGSTLGQKANLSMGAYLTSSLNPSEGFTGPGGIDGGSDSGANPSFSLTPHSGGLSGDGTYSLYETIILGNGYSDLSGTAATGTSTFLITFTAVPEPASLSLLALGGLILLARRRRA